MLNQRYTRFMNKIFHLIVCISLLPTLTEAAPAPVEHANPVVIKILGINDFHGQISVGRRINNRPVGGAAVIAAYLKNAQQGFENNTLLTFMGDQVGASTPASGLLHDEPAILFLNTLANKFCNATTRMDPQCNMVATVGNHEFDKGPQALFDKIYGTDKLPTDSWIPLPHYPGASFPYISANIVNEKTGENIFPPYVIKKVNGISIAFIGAIVKNAPDVIIPSGIIGVKFLDEAESINRYIPEIKAQGAHIIVVIIHEGGRQNSYTGDTRENTKVEGRIVDIVKQLNDVDVVMAGHTHSFLNAYLPNNNGKQTLVTQGNSYSSDFAEVTLTVDKDTQTALKKSARIITAYADQVPGTLPDQDAAKIVKLAEDKVEPIVTEQVGTSQTDLQKNGNGAGESNLGNLIADAMRSGMQADIAFMNAGGIRTNVYAGKVTWGNLYAVQPFGNIVVKMSLTGADIRELLEQQWTTERANVLQVSGLNYSYDANKPIGSRVVAVNHDGKPLQDDRTYIVATNDFLAYGGDHFTALRHGKILLEGDTDLTVLVNYVKQLQQPFTMTIEGRIKKVNS
jgi:5'-nucleotidase